MTPILFTRGDTGYKKYTTDCYDETRNAKSYTGNSAIVAHPPCRAWGVLSHMANPRPGEKELAVWAVEKVRTNGGVLEHPAGSKLWKYVPLPEPGMFPDEFGGYSILINQYDFGHVASKPTKLYIVGCPMKLLPPMPKKRTSTPLVSMTGQVGNTKRATQYEREYTPDALIQWLLMTVANINHIKASGQMSLLW